MAEDICQSTVSMALRAIKQLEQGHWYLAEREALKLNISVDMMNKYYQESIQWAECIDFYDAEAT